MKLFSSADIKCNRLEGGSSKALQTTFYLAQDQSFIWQIHQPALIHFNKTHTLHCRLWVSFGILVKAQSSLWSIITSRTLYRGHDTTRPQVTRFTCVVNNWVYLPKPVASQWSVLASEGLCFIESKSHRLSPHCVPEDGFYTVRFTEGLSMNMEVFQGPCVRWYLSLQDLFFYHLGAVKCKKSLWY